MFERFTDRARKVVVRAEEAAILAGSHHVSPSFLLLGILNEGQSFAARTVFHLGMTRDLGRRLAEESLSTEIDSEEDGILLNDETKACVENALSTSRRLNHDFVAPEHLLIGLLEDADFSATLRAFVDVVALRAALVEQIAPANDPKESADARAKRLGQRCTRCGASIERAGKVQDVSIGVQGGEPINVHAYYCGECGSTFGLVKSEADK